MTSARPPIRPLLLRSCLVYDFGSRNKKRGAPRAIWVRPGCCFALGHRRVVMMLVSPTQPCSPPACGFLGGLQYGLEFVRYALRRLWLGERGPAYLRGYSVAHVFEQHVSAFSTATKK